MSHYYEFDPSLASKPKQVSFEVCGEKLTLTSDIGVFSKNRLDEGTMILLDTIVPLINEDEFILDLGCGYGAVGMSIASIIKSARVLCVDVNPRAVSLAKLNADTLLLSQRVEARQSDIYENVDEIFDSIVLNPPIRAGKKVTYRMYLEGIKHLKTDGSMFIVIRKAQGALSALEYLESIFSNVKILKKKRGYVVIQAKR